MCHQASLTPDGGPIDRCRPLRGQKQRSGSHLLWLDEALQQARWLPLSEIGLRGLFDALALLLCQAFNVCLHTLSPCGSWQDGVDCHAGAFGQLGQAMTQTNLQHKVERKPKRGRQVD